MKEPKSESSDCQAATMSFSCSVTQFTSFWYCLSMFACDMAILADIRSILLSSSALLWTYSWRAGRSVQPCGHHHPSAPWGGLVDICLIFSSNSAGDLANSESPIIELGLAVVILQAKLVYARLRPGQLGELGLQKCGLNMQLLELGVCRLVGRFGPGQQAKQKQHPY